MGRGVPDGPKASMASPWRHGEPVAVPAADGMKGAPDMRGAPGYARCARICEVRLVYIPNRKYMLIDILINIDNISKRFFIY